MLRANQTLIAARQLRNLIRGGEFRAGDMLSERSLADALGVRRIPLRLALGELEYKGLVVRRPSEGFVVRTFDLLEVGDAICLRGVLEGSAARRAAERRQVPGRLDGLSTSLTAIDALLSRASVRSRPAVLREYARLNDRFHMSLIVAAESESLEAAYSRLAALPFSRPSASVLALLRHPEIAVPISIAQSQHQAIFWAIARGEAMRRRASFGAMRLSRR
jgi:GntR family transcriptional regulator of vanillate catabolism